MSNLSSLFDVRIALWLLFGMASSVGAFAEEETNSCWRFCASTYSNEEQGACNLGCEYESLNTGHPDSIGICTRSCPYKTKTLLGLLACEAGCEYTDADKTKKSISPEDIQKAYNLLKIWPLSPCGSAGECPSDVGSKVFTFPSIERFLMNDELSSPSR